MNKTSFFEITHFLADCKEELDDWFGIDLPMPELMILTSAQDLLDITGYEINEHPYIAWADTTLHRLYVLLPDEVAKIYPGHKDIFWDVVKHEYVHSYWHALVRSSYPVWMNEGLACYIAGESVPLATIKEMVRIQECFEVRSNKKAPNVYIVGYAMVEYLIEKFGRDKFVAFMNKLGEIADSKTKKLAKDKFEDLFKKHFGFGLTNTELTRVFGL